MVSDPEAERSYTVKWYHSDKIALDEDQFRHTKITLSPENKDFKDIVIENVSGDDFRIVAEWLGVL